MARKKNHIREKAYKIYTENNGEISNKEIAEILQIDKKKIATWKSKYKWKEKTDIRKQEIAKAKSLYIAGATLKQASESTGIPISTLSDYSRKEDWITSQKVFLDNVYSYLQNKYMDIHKENREKVIELVSKERELYISLLEEALNANESLDENDIQRIQGYQQLSKKIIASIMTEAKLLGIQEIKFSYNTNKDNVEASEDTNRKIEIEVIDE